MWCGLVERKEGFDPTIFPAASGSYMLTVALRFIRMVCIVPWVEELFWRGFLMRYVQAGEKEFTAIPFGKHSLPAYAIVTLAVTFIHAKEDWLAAFAWGSLMYYLAVRTRSLGACLVMHAVGNFLLGCYVMKTQQWGFW
jgi:CAAX prenyl protease-like protein